MPSLNHRADHSRLPGWTLEVVVRGGLGVLEDSTGGCFVIRLDGRAAGPVRFTLDPLLFRDWFIHRNGAGARAGRGAGAPRGAHSHTGLMTADPRLTRA